MKSSPQELTERHAETRTPISNHLCIFYYIKMNRVKFDKPVRTLEINIHYGGLAFLKMSISFLDLVWKNLKVFLRNNLIHRRSNWLTVANTRGIYSDHISDTTGLQYCCVDNISFHIFLIFLHLYFVVTVS